MRSRWVVLVVVACSSSKPTVVTPPVTKSGPVHESPPAAQPYSTSNRIAPTADGAIVIDADSGVLVRVDRVGTPVARVAIGRGAGQLAYDPQRELVFVADRMGDRVMVVDRVFRIARELKTPAEPFGVALSPDRSIVYVTTIADRTLVAFDTRTGAEQWRIGIAPEARGISISPDGKRALIASLTAGLDHVALDRRTVSRIELDLACESCAASTAFARGLGTVTFIDATRAIASFQRSIPRSLGERHTGVYGGGVDPPVTQHLAFLSFEGERHAQMVAQVAENQPRSIAWDLANDVMHVAGHGSDTLLQLRGLSSESTEEVEDRARNFVMRSTTGARCGPDGIALAPGGELLLWCAFSRTVQRLVAGELREGPVVVASSLTPQQHLGLVTFFATHRSINRDRALACASCHLDGRTDGLSWKIGARPLQTPVLAGRLANTHPFKWEGTDPTLAASIDTTVMRLGGAGLDDARRAALIAYLEALPRPRTPTREPALVARGQRVFDRDCRSCHAGPRFTDGKRHALESDLPGADTPSLVGLHASAPYYHDGSAASLDALVAGGGSVHGMAELDKLTADERRALVAYLETL